MFLLPAPATTLNIMEWVERLGGWGAVIWIVQRMMRSGDADRELFRAAIDEFRSFRAQEDAVHRAMIQTQERILAQIEAQRLETQQPHT